MGNSKSSQSLKSKLGTVSKSISKSLGSQSERQDSAVRDRYKRNVCLRADIAEFDIRGEIGHRTAPNASYYEVFHKPTKETLELRVLSKAKLETAYSKSRAVQEKKIHAAVEGNDFIVKLVFASQDTENLYFFTEYSMFGPLGSVLNTKLRDKTIRAIAAQIIIALQYLHRNGVIHRNVCPDSILIFADGFLKLGEFRNAKLMPISGARAFSILSCSPYMAPEMFGSEGHGEEVDYWALGILLFHAKFKRHPLIPDLWEADDCDVSRSIEFNEVTWFPDEENTPLGNLLKDLLVKDKTKRLGAPGQEPIEQHKFFEGFKWKDMSKKKCDIRIMSPGRVVYPIANEQFDRPEPLTRGVEAAFKHF
ncbi:cAMP-dependent protein kinase catalytic subunit 1-like [Galendromus occidentalis]|uniref:cAMP-dependent protein kinase catalytic subunit 1-like n=1 Tax=Galendromus occidentalis TaxID=34638 RepID=A0AAJ6QRE1_9ACAR|nr:cAMP-dependent protein kinase catalytic subunit 1-like [Galendromus occidentalis]